MERDLAILIDGLRRNGFDVIAHDINRAVLRESRESLGSLYLTLKSWGQYKLTKEQECGELKA